MFRGECPILLGKGPLVLSFVRRDRSWSELERGRSTVPWIHPCDEPRRRVVPLVSIAPLLFALATSCCDDLDDRELARSIRSGDHDAFRAFFDRYHGLLYGYLRRRGADTATAEDLVQQAFITIWERRAEIDPGRSLRAFLFKIGYNRALNHIRDTARFDGDDALADVPGSADPESAAAYALMRESLRDVVTRLPERRRAVFELCFLEELTYGEAAEALGISVKTVENQMAAALKTLRAAFEHYRAPRPETAPRRDGR